MGVGVRRLLKAFGFVLIFVAVSVPTVSAGSPTTDAGRGVRAVVEVDLASFWRDRTERPTRQERANRDEQLMDQSVEVIRRRASTLGLNPYVIQLQGNRIQIDLRGLSKTDQIREVFDEPHQLTLHLVDDKASSAAEKGMLTPASQVLMRQAVKGNESEPPLAINKKVILSGEHIADAQNALDENTNRPIVILHLDARGKQEVAKITRGNIGRRLAIVLDGKILSAPIIREEISGGSLEISGEFTPNEAMELAVLLRSGAVPVPIKLLKIESIPTSK